MFGLRQKLAFGFGGLLIILYTVGFHSTQALSQLSASIDAILKENYRSIIAAQEMKESLERMDNGVLFGLLGETEQGQYLIATHNVSFIKALEVQMNNITLPGEKTLVDKLAKLHAEYQQHSATLFDNMIDWQVRREVYFKELLPLLLEVKNTSNQILHMNQENMVLASIVAHDKATAARQQMYWLLTGSAILTVLFILFIGHTVLQPLRRLTLFARQVGAGKLDLVVRVPYQDELGNLAEAFNAMVERLREVRRSDQARLLRIQQTTQLAIDNLPDAIAVFNPQNKVELANRIAIELFGLRPDAHAKTVQQTWLPQLLENCVLGQTVRAHDYESAIQIFYQGQELFFLPQARAIRDPVGRLIGIVVTLSEVTLLRKADAIKSGFLSTVSKELRAPLNSINLALYVLLDEKVGNLNPKQTELALAASQDAEKLLKLVDNLLDLSGLETDTLELGKQVTTVREIVSPVKERLWAIFENQGVNLITELPPTNPKISADSVRIQTVLTHLLENALKRTPSGGQVQLRVWEENQQVLFQISDNGTPIPSSYQPRIFERFFRIPGENSTGLDLAIAKEIIEAYQGSIEYVSSSEAEDNGNTFQFSLPSKSYLNTM